MNIVAIGGGDKGPAMRSARAGLENPNVLIVPSACSTEVSYGNKVAACKHFFDSLGMPSVVLHLLHEKPSRTKVEHEFGRAGMIYTIGGHTPTLLEKISQHGSDEEIVKAIARDVMHAGTSAGAFLPFKTMHSCVAKKPEKEVWDYELLEGLGIVRAVAAVHADQHDMTPDGARPDSRLEHLAANFPRDVQVGFGIDNGAALIVRDGLGLVISTQPEARVHALLPLPGNPVVPSIAIEDGTHLMQIMHDYAL